MAKIITVTFEGKKYDLTYNREVVAAMERSGFSVDQVTAMPITRVPQLFRGSLVCNHPKMTTDEADRMWEGLVNKEKLVATLILIYRDVVNTLFEAPEDEEKNATWETNW
ncbi:MAG: DUF5055 domain-containing protein [Clostridia bacterium]|nr:DUF5055 domain-containing protein [Clostridia bacterium]